MSAIIPKASDLQINVDQIDVSEVTSAEDQAFLIEKGTNILQIVARAALEVGQQIVEVQDRFNETGEKGLQKFYASIGISQGQALRWSSKYRAFCSYIEIFGKEARALLKSEKWVRAKVAKYTKQTKAKIRKREKEGIKFQAPDYSAFRHGLDPDEVTRSTTKRLVMVTAYGGTIRSKAEYIAEALEEAFEENPYDPSIIDKRLVTDACIEGLATAFPQTDVLNTWFADVGKAAMEKGLEYVSWRTSSGSFIRQEDREPATKLVKTRAMGSNRYHKISEEKKHGARIELTVQTGWGDVRKGKASTALGANFTHSFDSDILQRACVECVGNFFGNHDCQYTLAPYTEENTLILRKCFEDVVRFDGLQSLLDTNELKEMTQPTKGQGCLDEIVNSEYLFS